MAAKPACCKREAKAELARVEAYDAWVEAYDAWVEAYRVCPHGRV